jgi:lipopolysaccharide transport system ATP-binding protein
MFPHHNCRYNWNMGDVAIRVEGLGKQYALGGKAPYFRFTEALQNFAKAPLRMLQRRNDSKKDRTFWALKDVSFEVKKGEAIGIIGRNGAGKSTLLKILSRITEMTEGGVDIFGRVGSLLEVGTGFHPELTGRENIYLNGAILGMKRPEIRGKFDEIVAFAEVEKFLDTPVKRYSSGMYMRLAFAVAAHLEPEILVVDEVLAVGDAQFQKKCLGKMGEVAHSGRTVIFVSHNLSAVSAMCRRAVFVASGRIASVGESHQVIERYLADSKAAQKTDVAGSRIGGLGKEVRFAAVTVRGQVGDRFRREQPLEFDLEIECVIPMSGLTIAASVFCETGCLGTVFAPGTFSVIPGACRRVRLRINPAGLVPGSYHLGMSIGHGGVGSARIDHDIILGAPHFEIDELDADNTPFTQWQSNWGKLRFRGELLTFDSAASVAGSPAEELPVNSRV